MKLSDSIQQAFDDGDEKIKELIRSLADAKCGSNDDDWNPFPFEIFCDGFELGLTCKRVSDDHPHEPLYIEDDRTTYFFVRGEDLVLEIVNKTN